jgi:hypothetical protein
MCDAIESAAKPPQRAVLLSRADGVELRLLRPESFAQGGPQVME